MADLRKMHVVYIFNFVLSIDRQINFAVWCSILMAGQCCSIYGVGLDMAMGWIGSWVHKFTWKLIGLGRVRSVTWLVGLAWVDENRTTDNSVSWRSTFRVFSHNYAGDFFFCSSLPVLNKPTDREYWAPHCAVKSLNIKGTLSSLRGLNYEKS